MSSETPARTPVSVPLDRRDRDTLERAAAALRSGRALSLKSRDGAVADAAERIVRAYDDATRPAISSAAPQAVLAALDELATLVRDDHAASALQRLRRALAAPATP